MTTPEMKPLTVEQIEGMRYMLNIHKAVDAVDVDRLCDMAITATRPTPQPSSEYVEAVETIEFLIQLALNRLQHDFSDFNGTHTKTCPACRLVKALGQLATIKSLSAERPE